MADRIRLVQLPDGGRRRPIVLLDLADGVNYVPTRDTWKYTPGPKRASSVVSDRRWGGTRETGAAHDNAIAERTLNVRGGTDPNLAFANVETLVQHTEDYHGKYIEWRPEGAARSVYMELRGTASWGPDYKWAQFAGARSLEVPIQFPVAPLGRGDALDYSEDWTGATIAAGTPDGYTDRAGNPTLLLPAGASRQLVVADIPAGWSMGHRLGGANVAPDNALESMPWAFDRGAFMLDGGDIRLTSDGAMVSMHDSTLDRTTDGTGAIAALTLAQVKTPRIDADTWLAPGWNGTYRVPTFDEILTQATALGAVITPEVKDPAAAASMVAAITAHGMTNSVIFQSFLIADLAPAEAAGMKTCLLSDGTAGVPTVASMQAAGVDYLAYSSANPGAFTAAYLQSVYDAGIKLAPWTITRISEVTDEQTRVGRPLAWFASDDPMHTSAAYTALRDTWADGRWMPGMRLSAASSGYRGAMAFGKYQLALTGTYWTMLGWARMSSSFQIDIRYDQLATDTTRWVGVAFGAATDRSFHDGTTSQESAYLALLRESGSMSLFKRDSQAAGGASTLLGGPQGTAAIAAGGSATLKVEFLSSTQVKVTRVDTGHSITVTDSSLRGPFVHVGKADSTPGLLASFSNAIVA